MARPADERPPRKRYLVSDPESTIDDGKIGVYDTFDAAVKRASTSAMIRQHPVEVTELHTTAWRVDHHGTSRPIRESGPRAA